MDTNERRLVNILGLLSQYKSQRLFAEAIGVQTTEISQIKNRTSPRNVGHNLARRIEVELNLDHGWMDLPHGSQKISNPHVGRAEVWAEEGPIADDEKEVIVYIDMETKEDVKGDIKTHRVGYVSRMSERILDSCGVKHEHAAFIKVSGSSMEPRLYDGDIAAINTESVKVADGKIYAVNHAGIIKIRRLYKPTSRLVTMRCLNSAEFESITVPVDDEFYVLGQVFWSCGAWNN